MFDQKVQSKIKIFPGKMKNRFTHELVLYHGIMEFMVSFFFLVSELGAWAHCATDMAWHRGTRYILLHVDMVSVRTTDETRQRTNNKPQRASELSTLLHTQRILWADYFVLFIKAKQELNKKQKKKEKKKKKREIFTILICIRKWSHCTPTHLFIGRKSKNKISASGARARTFARF